MTPRGSKGAIGAPDKSLVSRLTRLSILEPTTREVGARRLRWSLLVLPLAAVGLVLAVREVGRVERLLSVEGARAQRVIVYELKPGAELRVPIEPGTDVLRVVAHLIRRGALASGPHPTRLLISATGSGGTRHDDITFSAPATTQRASSEDPGISVGDPTAVNIDTHGLGTGELRIALDSVADADGLLLRVYRRERLDAHTVADRPARLRPEAKLRLAQHAGELDWDELESDEQALLLAARWRRVAAIAHANKGIPTRAIVLAPPSDGPPMLAPDPPLAAVDVRGDELLAVLAHGKTSLRARAEGDPAATVVATVRRHDGRVETVTGVSEVTIDVPESEEVGVELTRTTPGRLSLRGSDPARLELPGYASAWRAAPHRPVVVRAGDEPLVLRVGARRAVPRGSVESFTLALDATITNDDAKVESTPNQSVVLRASRARSPYERYDEGEPAAAPTTSAVFHFLVPPRGTLTLSPVQGTVDISLAELDPHAPPRAIPAYPVDKPFPKVRRVGEVLWGGYVPRRPSNHELFESATDGRVVLRVPQRLIPLVEPDTRVPTFRVKRPDAADLLVRDRRVFEPTSVTFEIDLPAGDALVLPVRAYAHEKLDLVANIDGAALGDARRPIGAAGRVSTARTFTVDGEVRTVVVLGDDLRPGKHLLTFEPPSGKKAWVHLPWTPKPRRPGAPPPDPHWIEGDLED